MSEIDERPEVSIVVECDNLVSAGDRKARHMLGELARQVKDAGRDTETLLFYNPEEVRRQLLEEMVSQSGLDSACTVSLHAAEGLRYYELKNAGVGQARADIVAFIDTDVRPEPGWLTELLAPLEDPSVQFVAGNTYVGPPADLYTKSFALFWNFPLRHADGPPRRERFFHANNFAARRALLQTHPFPSDDRYRGQCATLARQLADEGVAIWYTPMARTMHPPPRGFTYRRALWRGHDLYRSMQEAGDTRHASYMGSLRVLGSYLEQSASRIVRFRRAVGLSPVEVPAAVAIATSYIVTVWAGFVLARARPEMIARLASHDPE